MRQAAGIMLIIFGMFLLNTSIYGLSGYGIDIYEIVFDLLMIIPVAFLITGGIFCLQKKYWRVCLASAWFAVFIMILWLTGSHPDALGWLSWAFSILGTLPIIFVYLAKTEWKEIQD
jgi:hypothetical protein